ncbi:MAG: hypothetical protein A3C27_01065 [Candidatus Levybacteria bacterium RIFCSPHIGHO2_02_FULL_39_36]|nr:MAG: hypothetical protein A2689_03085 [Candidatus Levybacteria bacterium RIFCSPHIGHO2_01_FULL_38_96]OGH25447.1 MAG: hypothetical protein A3E68_01060 [Candidatus Levybacteria bacterium RIFCSPHIGHO2_12_FULL_39_39]OGH28404.1 MAG: hypothetical protein A3C27_01065 [Candidatus Levybacteria bacterium RIFCSPHIGHO2_02_FULL_39_36]OGH35942.1 MAG: hypothetical protein A3B43_00415 [Candidatus Levybacteria bacterium RIFCSPLOWO2_01_FULL_38_120]OGH45697.1 MAG: hypothetical protein A3H82_03430 [Candidatus Le
MRVQFNRSHLILSFGLLNLLILSFLIYLLLITWENRVLPIGGESKPISLAFFDKNIEDLHVNSKSFIIYDPRTRSRIAGKNEDLRFSPASAVKIMTALVVLDEYPQDEALIVSNIKDVKGSKMGLEDGEVITVKNLLYGLMLPSGNDAAFVLSQNYPAGPDEFIERMNEKAMELKLKNTKFIDQSGYSDDNYTTAYDLARLAAYSLKNKYFAQIVSTKTATVYDVSKKIEHKLVNLNELLSRDGVVGVKTGFTEEAGGVLVSSLIQEGKLYIIVVLNSPDRFQATNNIIDAIKNLNLISY